MSVAGSLAAAAAAPPRLRRMPMVDDSDETLLMRVANADRDAFALLFRRYAGKIKSYLIRLGARPAVAEDLAQDAMVLAWRRAGLYDPAKAKASTWMFVIARNAWIDKLRREKVELAYAERNGEADLSREEAPDEAAVRMDQEEKVALVLETLTPEQRQVVQLSFFEERPHSEIAERLSLPLGTVKSRMRLALTKLRALLEDLS